MRILVFGDSITQGFWDTEGGWVDRLRKHFDELQVQDFDKDQPTIFNLGISADTSREILARAKNEVRARTRHNVRPVVIVQIGVNDSFTNGQGRPAVPLEEYKTNLQAIVAALQPISSKIIFVGLTACDEAKTLLVVWGDYYYSNDRLKAYEDQMRAVADEQTIAFVPVFAHFKETMKTGELLADGLHPNNEGHRILFEIVKLQLLALLGDVDA